MSGGAASVERGEGARLRVGDLQRRRLIEATIDVVAEHGAAAMTVERVVIYAGVSRRTFYELFASSKDCFLATFEHCLGCATVPVREAYEREGRWQERVRAGLMALLCFLEEQPEMGRLLLVECSLAGTRALQQRAAVVERLTAVVQLGAGERKAGEAWPQTIAEGVVGAVLSVIGARLVEKQESGLTDLAGTLTSIVVLPYLGAAAARRELERAPVTPARAPSSAAHKRRKPFEKLDMRLTYRTALVLSAIAKQPGASNRAIGNAAGIVDQGQISKLLARLLRLGLIENRRDAERASANAWVLTDKGAEVQSPMNGAIGGVESRGR